MKIAYEEKNTLLCVDNLHIRFAEDKILEGVRLEIKDVVQKDHTRGQIQSILGPSGVGKTILLRAISGLLQADSGKVQIALDGKTLYPVRPGLVGVVWQNYPLFDHLTVWENLLLASGVTRLSKQEAQKKAQDLLERFDLEERKDFWPSQLSGGQRQRVAILQQIMVQNLFLIMDEPFSGLDPSALNEVLQLIRELADSDELQTILLVTHDIRAALRISDYIHILGRDIDDKGVVKRAGHFMESINLLEKGIAWQEDPRNLAEFHQLLSEIEDKFEGI